LAKLAEATGGGYFEITSPIDVSSAFVRVAEELHHQYAMGFAPEKLDGKMHEIAVRVSKPDLRARARKRYLASKPVTPLVAPARRSRRSNPENVRANRRPRRRLVRGAAGRNLRTHRTQRAGKTTTMECNRGAALTGSGTVSVLGLDPARDRDALHSCASASSCRKRSCRKRIKVWGSGVVLGNRCTHAGGRQAA